MSEASDLISAVEFSVRAIGLQAARLCSAAYTEAKEKFAAEKPRSLERSARALEIQRSKRDLDLAVKINRRRFRLLSGEKP